jgi:type VII secretion protein EccB
VYGRRDQVQAHSFLAGRLVSAVLRVDPDSAERPLRRTTAGLLGGIGIAVLVTGVVVAVSLFGGRAPDWREPGVLVVEAGTGSRYLLVDGRLRPVLNYASARLLTGGAPKPVEVEPADLDQTPRGTPIGILGAPDALPASSAAQPWTVCAGPGSTITLTVGAQPGALPAADDQIGRAHV